jgi:hypothetical protein
MTRVETLLKLLNHGGLTYTQLVQTTGWPASEVHETVAACKADKSIVLRHRTRQGLVPIYELNPDAAGSLEAIKTLIHPIFTESPAPEVPDVGEIKAVMCQACGFDAVGARRGFTSGECRHKGVCNAFSI